MIDYKVGMTLWFREHGSRSVVALKDGHEVTVEKVGRKWVYLRGRMRVKVGSVDVDGGNHGSPGRLWVDQTACQEEDALRVDWVIFKCGLTYNPPENLTIEKLREVRALLGIA